MSEACPSPQIRLLSMTHINEMNSKTIDGTLDEQIGSWWLVETDIGLAYATVVDWRRAYGRIDWVVRSYGDLVAAGTIGGSRFITKEEPPLKRSDRSSKKIDLQSVDRGAVHHRDVNTINPEHRKLRRADDPIAQALASEAQPPKKRRRRRHG